MLPHTINRQIVNESPFKIEFSNHSARIAQNTGYKLTSFAATHSLEFSEPPKRRSDTQMQFTNPPPSSSNVSSMDAYTKAMEEADSFLDVNNFHDPQFHMLTFPTDTQMSNPTQTTSIQTTTKSSHPKADPPKSPPLQAIQEETGKNQNKSLKEPRKEKLEKEEPTHHFELLYQPNEKQRKSYKNENRYILPNPLTIVLTKQSKDKKVKVEKGSVVVSLLYDTGEELEENREHVLDGIKMRALDKEKKAQFHLKVVETSDRNRFRLQFMVKFFVNKVEHVEKIVSHCFRVTSNKKIASIERPRPFAIKPNHGPTSSETEVWIRGKLFTDRTNTTVTFGGKEARIIETEENILICYAPIRDDIKEDLTVEVRVTNHKGDQSEYFDASKVLEFTYIVPDRKRKRVKVEADGEDEDDQENEPKSKEQTNENNMLYCPPSLSAYPHPQLDEIVKNESELVDRLGYFFPTYFPTEAN